MAGRALAPPARRCGALKPGLGAREDDLVGLDRLERGDLGAAVLPVRGMHMWVPNSSTGSSMVKPASVDQASSHSAPPGLRMYIEKK